MHHLLGGFMPYSYIFFFFLLMTSKTALSVFDENAQAQALSPRAHVKGRLLVKLGHRVSPVSLAEIERGIGAKKIYSFSLVEGLYLYQLDPNINIEEAQQNFLQTGAAIYAEPDYFYSTQAIEDPQYQRQWSLENTGQNGGVPDADINAEMTWAIETGKKDVVVAVIDTGVDYTHPDLIDSMWHNNAEIPGNNKDDDQNGYVDDVYGINVIAGNGNPMDDNKHGTHVAGTIGAAGNKIGVRGVALGIQIAACKFLSASGSGSVSDAVKCLEYFAKLKSRAKDPVNIVASNNSWGGGAFSQAMLDAIKAHEKLGILFIAAAGNSSENNDVVERFPCNYRVPNVVSVAATDNRDQLAVFSSYGKKTVHVAAPGVKVLSTVLHHDYAELSGTSMATPHVTGLAALIASHYPQHNYQRIKNLIMAGGQLISSVQDITISGRRIRGADKNGVGSLTCQNQLLRTRLSPIGASERIPVGSDLLISSLAIDCAESPESITLYDRAGVKIVLRDNGQNGDAKANDGIYSLRWVPQTPGDYAIDFGVGDVFNISVFNPNTSYDLLKSKELQERSANLPKPSLLTAQRSLL